MTAWSIYIVACREEIYIFMFMYEGVPDLAFLCSNKYPDRWLVYCDPCVIHYPFRHTIKTLLRDSEIEDYD